MAIRQELTVFTTCRENLQHLNNSPKCAGMIFTNQAPH